MTKATLDQTLQSLQRAEDWIRRTHKTYIGMATWVLPAADHVAIVILKDAAQRVLKGDAQ